MFLTVIFLLCGIARTFAATIGVINMEKVQQQHKDFTRAQNAYEQLVRNYRNEFNSRYAQKTLGERKEKVAYYNSQLDREKKSIFRKINEDIQVSIESVAKEKCLAGVVSQGIILDGQIIDITDEVCGKLQNIQ